MKIFKIQSSEFRFNSQFTMHDAQLRTKNKFKIQKYIANYGIMESSIPQ
jgi:hypothetical protein